MTETGTERDEHQPAWSRACLALDLLAIDPVGLGGMTVRARAGPVRDLFLRRMVRLPMPLLRVHPQIGDDALFGGLDLGRTLAQGRYIRSEGLAGRSGVLMLAMAERSGPGLAARFARLLDSGARAMILLDEGADEDERPPGAICERLAFHVDLSDVALAEAQEDAVPDLANARSRYRRIAASGEDVRTLVALAARFGIDTMRAPMLAMRAARAHAALVGRDRLEEGDLRAGAELVFPARATRLPAPPEPQDAPDQPDLPPDTGDATARDPGDLPREILIEAVRALLPDGLLTGLATPGHNTAAGGSGAGRLRKGNRRGRPLPPRPGRLNGRSRVDLVATLQACAPWQTIRRMSMPQAGRIIIFPSDIRVKRYQDKSDRLLIFVVDASGSAAVSRLSEAKGAVELLLAQSYAQRDHVALIGFRGDGADLLLPPTRSLVQTKRRLAALPGGGGTPLATGLQAAVQLAEHSERQGLTPSILLLTDGRANITLSGAADRPRAQGEAEQIASLIGARRIGGVVLDIGNRPHPPLKTLSQAMQARYVPLPRADARRMSEAVGAALAP